MFNKSQKFIGIGGGIAAAVIIAIVSLSYSSDAFLDEPMTSSEVLPEIISENEVTDQFTSENELPNTQSYRINTQCELLYSMTRSVYPNDEPIPPLTMSNLVEKYPEKFEPWKDIIADEEKFQAFVQQGIPSEFTDAVVSSLINEYSINPDLDSTVALLNDPQAQAKLQQLFNEYQCQQYFEDRQAGQN